MNQLDMSIARLRLLLKEIEAKEKQIQAARRQFRDQLERVINFALYRDPSLDQTLAMMADVDQRSENTEQIGQHLSRLRARVQSELDSLQLTKSFELAKLELAELEARKVALRRADSPDSAGAEADVAALDAEIERLRVLINDASERAVETLARRGR
ncbi:MAG: hypothetical protein EXR58_07360 [Chloroflexi bacterium]|nr:hypothetical protein [Chloroflexota bacterium]